jgi:hypothetical protein
MKKIPGHIIIGFIISSFLYACAARKLPPAPAGLFQLEGNWQLVLTNDDDSALAGSIISIDPATADAIITVLKKNAYCVRPTDAAWKNITTTDIRNQFNTTSLGNSCTSGLEYKPATLILVNDELKLTGTTSQGKVLLQTWKKIK